VRPWRDAPTCYRPWQTVYGRFRCWQGDGTSIRILTGLQARADAAGLITSDVSVDTTIARDLVTSHRWFSSFVLVEFVDRRRRVPISHRR